MTTVTDKTKLAATLRSLAREVDLESPSPKMETKSFPDGADDLACYDMTGLREKNRIPAAAIPQIKFFPSKVGNYCTIEFATESGPDGEPFRRLVKAKFLGRQSAPKSGGENIAATVASKTSIATSETKPVKTAVTLSAIQTLRAAIGAGIMANANDPLLENYFRGLAARSDFSLRLEFSEMMQKATAGGGEWPAQAARMRGHLDNLAAKAKVEAKAVAAALPPVPAVAAVAEKKDLRWFWKNNEKWRYDFHGKYDLFFLYAKGAIKNYQRTGQLSRENKELKDVECPSWYSETEWKLLETEHANTTPAANSPLAFWLANADIREEFQNNFDAFKNYLPAKRSQTRAERERFDSIQIEPTSNGRI